jgi:hypothetical protein
LADSLQDTETSSLVAQIDKATALGIRVAFGFLTSSSTVQASDVLTSIMRSGGRYFTIPSYTGAKDFIDGILVNGLTKNDNPDGDSSTLISGLDTSHFISGSETQTMTYKARDKERLTFGVQSVTAGILSYEIKFGTKSLATGQSSNLTYSIGSSVVTAPGNGNIDVNVVAKGVSKDSIFVVGVTSNLPRQNCTVGFGELPDDSNNGLKEKVGTGIGVGIGLPLLLSCIAMLIKKCWPRKKHRNSQHPHAPDTSPGLDDMPPSGSEKPGFFSFPPTAVPPLPPPIKPKGRNKSMWDFPDHTPSTQAGPQQSPPQYGDQCPPDQHPDDLHSLHNEPRDLDNDAGSEYIDLHDPTHLGDPSENEMPNQSSDQSPYQPSDSQPPSDYPQDPQNPNQNPQDPYQNPTDPTKQSTPRFIRLRTYGNNHHHHIHSEHACYTDECDLAKSDHGCPDTTHKCTCIDPKCELNSRMHRCKNKNFPHKCMGPGIDPTCPMNDPEYAQQKKDERSALVRKYVAQDLALKGITMTAWHLASAGGM